MGYAKKRTGAAAGTAPRVAQSAKVSSAKKAESSSIWNMQIGGAKQKTDMKRVEVLLFVSELADLLEAGMTLGQALQALANQGEETSAQHFVCQDTHDARQVRGLLRRCCDEVARSLRTRGLMARTLTVKLRYADLSYTTRAKTMDHPADAAR